jgi:hypothetical protein
MKSRSFIGAVGWDLVTTEPQPEGWAAHQSSEENQYHRNELIKHYIAARDTTGFTQNVSPVCNAKGNEVL